MRRYLTNTKGFSMAETLVVLVILVVSLSAFTIGFSAVPRIYKESKLVSESGVLSDSINIALSEVLRYARNVVVDDNGNVTSLTSTTKAISAGNVYFDVEEGYVSVHSTSSDKGRSIVNRGMYMDEIRVKDFSLSYADKVFQGEYTVYLPNDSFEKKVSFSYRTIAQTQ